jgi:hypothetical protein
MIHLCSVVTNKTLKEFFLLKDTIELFHKCYWTISCDEMVFKSLNNIDNIKCIQNILSDDCNHNTVDENKKNNWMNVMMTKFDCVEDSIKNFGYGFFLDSDMIFVNSVQKNILNLIKDENIDAFVCQHMTNNWQVEAKHGAYNAGMFVIRNMNFLNEWKSLSKDYKKYNFYFEQQPLEFIQRNFTCINLPINYNIGWWRFNSQETVRRLEKFNVAEDQIMFGNLPVVNFHVHTVKNENINYGQFLLDKIIALLKQSQSTNHKKIVNLLEKISD